MRIWPGTPYPLGATYDGTGTNFSVFSEVAERVELCLFDEAGREERIDLPESTGFNWHGYLPGIEPGERYGYRVHGPWNPDAGQRANPAKLLVDPYAKAVAGAVHWHEAVFPYRFGDPVRLGARRRRAAGVDPAPRPPAPRARQLPAPALVPGAAHPARGEERHRLVPARRGADGRRGLEPPRGPHPGGLPERPGHPHPRRPRREEGRQYLLSDPPRRRRPLPFRLPDAGWGERWVKVLDTREALLEEGGEPFAAGAEVPLVGRSVVLLRRLE